MNKWLITFLLVFGVGLIGWSGYRFFETKKNQQATLVSEWDQLTKERDETYQMIIDNSKARYAIYNRMIEEKKINPSKVDEIRSTIDFLQSLKFDSQEAIDRFEQLNLTLNDALSDYLSKNQAELKKANSPAQQLMREFELNGRALDQLKMRHSKLVQNALKISPDKKSEFPFFRAAMLTLENTQKPAQ